MKITSRKIEKLQEGGNIPSANAFWKTNSGKSLMNLSSNLMSGVANLMSQKAQNKKYNTEVKNQLQKKALNMEYTAKNDRDLLIGNITPTTEIQNGETINNSGLADKNYVYTNAGGMFHAKNNFQRYADNYLADLEKQQGGQFGSQVGGMIAQALPQAVQGIKDYRQFQDNRLEAYRNQQQNNQVT